MSADELVRLFASSNSENNFWRVAHVQISGFVNSHRQPLIKMIGFTVKTRSRICEKNPNAAETSSVFRNLVDSTLECGRLFKLRANLWEMTGPVIFSDRTESLDPTLERGNNFTHSVSVSPRARQRDDKDVGIPVLP